MRNNKIALPLWCLILSIFTLVAYNGRFFRMLRQCAGENGHQLLLTLSAGLFLLAALFLLYLLLAFLGRFVGKCVIALSFLVNAVTLYSLRMYNALVSEEMMANTFLSKYSEISGYISLPYFIWFFFLGLLPAAYVLLRKVDYGSWKRFLSAALLALAVAAAVVAGNWSKKAWVQEHALELGGSQMPWSWAVNSVRFFYHYSQPKEPEILLPDATVENGSRDVCVLVLGESARRDHFSLYGYPRETNPYTRQDSVKALPARAANTYTMACIREMMEPYPSEDLVEILPNYLLRAGVDVVWRTRNWGEPPVHTDKYYKVEDLQRMYPDADPRYDGILLSGLKDEILSCGKDKLFIVLHTYTNHGPEYRAGYPPEFVRFQPVGNTVRLARTDPELIRNGYDNSLVYSDFLVHSVIETLREIPDRRCCMLYMSDHGESLGENGNYLHAAPLSMAPEEQLNVPFLIWTSDPSVRVKPMDEVTPYSLYHSVLRFLGISSPFFDESRCVFEP